MMEKINIALYFANSEFHSTLQHTDFYVKDKVTVTSDKDSSSLNRNEREDIIEEGK